jgi:predicted Zn finger-like uncharacterized protein
MTTAAHASLQTRCGYCDTVLAVTAKQLQSDSGLLACSDCGKVFNAAWNLIDQVANPAQLAQTIDTVERSAVTPTPELRPFKSQRVTGAGGRREGDEAQPAPSATSEPPAWENFDVMLGGRSEPRLNATNPTEALATPPRQTNTPAEGSGWVWPLAGIFIACLALFTQARFGLLEEIASVVAARPALNAMCRYTDCELPQTLTGPTIVVTHTSIDLHRHLPNALIVRVHLQNRSHSAQDYPALELTLNGRSGKVLGRRSYLPREFSVVNESVRIGADRSAIVTLILAQPDPVASGFSARVVRS